MRLRASCAHARAIFSARLSPAHRAATAALSPVYARARARTVDGEEAVGVEGRERAAHDAEHVLVRVRRLGPAAHVVQALAVEAVAARLRRVALGAVDEDDHLRARQAVRAQAVRHAGERRPTRALGHRLRQRLGRGGRRRRAGLRARPGPGGRCRGCAAATIRRWAGSALAVPVSRIRHNRMTRPMDFFPARWLWFGKRTDSWLTNKWKIVCHPPAYS